MRSHLILCGCAFLTIAIQPIRAQNTPNTDGRGPTLRSTTRAVVVDVVVAKGDAPVIGLGRQQFEVFEDGKPQTLDFFEEHSAKDLPSGELAPLPKMPAGIYTNVPPAPTNDSVNVLLLDALNTDKDDQIYVHNQIIQFLKTMQPGTRAAIFTLSSQLRMVQGFTTDSTALHKALNDPAYGVAPVKPEESRSLHDNISDAQHIETMVMMNNGHWTEGISAIQSFARVCKSAGRGACWDDAGSSASAGSLSGGSAGTEESDLVLDFIPGFSISAHRRESAAEPAQCRQHT